MTIEQLQAQQSDDDKAFLALFGVQSFAHLRRKLNKDVPKWESTETLVYQVHFNDLNHPNAIIWERATRKHPDYYQVIGISVDESVTNTGKNTAYHVFSMHILTSLVKEMISKEANWFFDALFQSRIDTLRQCYYPVPGRSGKQFYQLLEVLTAE